MLRVEGMSGLDNYFVPTASTMKTAPGPALGATDITTAYLGDPPCFLNLQGAGQTIGLVEVAGFNYSDITKYGQYFFGTSSSPYIAEDHVSVTRVSVVKNGVTSSLPPFSVVITGNPQECPLDIEMAIGMAPLAHVTAFEDGLPDVALRLIAGDPSVNQVSTSWGNRSTAATQTLLLALASRGTTVFDASGDGGAWEPFSDIISCPTADVGGRTGTGLAPLNDMRALPYVTLVGGTQLLTSKSTAAWSGEETWATSPSGASAGGIFFSSLIPSASVPIPSWQIGANPNSNYVSTQWRNGPDVSFVANEVFAVTTRAQLVKTKFGTYATVLESGNRSLSGTSAAAPLWAGFTALTNEYGKLLGRQPVGFVNPAIYAIGGGPDYETSFHDIQCGGGAHTCDNTNTCGFGFPAEPGYDLATGWGTPTCSLLPTVTPPVRKPIAVGNGFACAVTSTGGVECWGDNEFGQLGNGKTASSSLPVPVTGLGSGVTDVSAGDGFACAVTSRGGVMCWGLDEMGELGVNVLPTGGANSAVANLCSGSFDGVTSDNFPCSRVPLAVVGANNVPITGATSVSAGQDSACIVTKAGSVQCWGDNAYASLGNRGPTGACGAELARDAGVQEALYPCSLVPVQVTDLTSQVVSVSVGAGSACALSLSSSGSTNVECWGRNDASQLGYVSGVICKAQVLCTGVDGHPCPEFVPCSFIPQAVQGLSGATSISAGSFFSCAVTTSGGVECWGDDTYDELETSAPIDCPPGQSDCYELPVQVNDLTSGVTGVSAGAAACALEGGAGGVLCWGVDFFGELGNGTFSMGAFPPAPVTGLSSGTFAVSAGYTSACSYSYGGSVQCWGDNRSGELGNGDEALQYSTVPVAVAFP
jgi:alpha-tubulin suppressor-like RCC1 family protein